MLAEALQAAREIDRGSGRAFYLKALAERLPEALLAEALQAARAIDDKDSRARVLEQLAERVIDNADLDRHRIWTQLVVAHATGSTRAKLLASPSIIKLITTLGDAAAAEEAAHWVERVERWWP